MLYQEHKLFSYHCKSVSRGLLPKHRQSAGCCTYQGAVAGFTKWSRCPTSNAHQCLVQVLALVLPTQRVLSYIGHISIAHQCCVHQKQGGSCGVFLEFSHDHHMNYLRRECSSTCGPSGAWSGGASLSTRSNHLNSLRSVC